MPNKVQKLAKTVFTSAADPTNLDRRLIDELHYMQDDTYKNITFSNVYVVNEMVCVTIFYDMEILE